MEQFLHLDFETFSLLDVSEVGAYRYAEHPSTEPLCLAYARNEAEPKVWIPYRHGDECPEAIERAIDEGFLFCAHNAQFERAVWLYVMVARLGWPDVPAHRWRCTACMAGAAGYPRGLDAA